MKPVILEDINVLPYLNEVEFNDGVMSVEKVVGKCPINIEQIFVTCGEFLFRKSKKVEENMLLGWDTVAKFKKQGGGFVLEEIVAGGCGTEVLPDETVYKTVVTAAVDTCTFVMLECGDSVVLAHLDRGRLSSHFKEILEFLPAENRVTGFCSYINDKQNDCSRTNFVRDLQKAYGNGIELCLRHYVNDSNPDHYCGHFEIGIYSDENGITQLFGDVTANPRTTDKSTQYHQFNNSYELQKFVLENFTANGCGGCIII